MKLSLQEIREENLAKEGAIDRTIIKLVPRYVPKIQQDKNASCKKHGTLAKLAAKLGSQRTKAKRWRTFGDQLSYPNSFISDKDFGKLEDMHQKAKVDFHKEPCTCSMK